MFACITIQAKHIAVAIFFIHVIILLVFDSCTFININEVDYDKLIRLQL